MSATFPELELGKWASDEVALTWLIVRDSKGSITFNWAANHSSRDNNIDLSDNNYQPRESLESYLSRMVSYERLSYKKLHSLAGIKPLRLAKMFPRIVPLLALGHLNEQVDWLKDRTHRSQWPGELPPAISQLTDLIDPRPSPDKLDKLRLIHTATEPLDWSFGMFFKDLTRKPAEPTTILPTPTFPRWGIWA